MENPLVSICTVTYNSEKTIVETLESFKSQTYSPIEVIISDDFSKDNTCKVVKDWIQENGSHFENIKLIENAKNNGVAINIDIAIKNSSGKWIKILAGDDILVPNCIEKFMRHTAKTDKEFLVSSLEVFSDEKFNLEDIQSFYDSLLLYEMLPLEKKKKIICEKLFVPGPGWFFSIDLYNRLGGMDYSYPMMDEWPFVNRLLFSDNDIYVIDEKLVKYRVSEKSLSHNKISNIRMLEDNISFFFNVRERQLLRYKKILTLFRQRLLYHENARIISYYKKTGKIKKIQFSKIADFFKRRIKKNKAFTERMAKGFNRVIDEHSKEL